jgi:hypothetical protein
MPASDGGTDRVELDSVHERVFVYWSGVRSALAQRLAVELASSSDVLSRDRREGDKLHGVDLDLTETDPVAAARLDPSSLPQPDRKRDVSGQHVAAQLRAELHTRDVSRRAATQRPASSIL